MATVTQFREDPETWRDLNIDTRGKFKGQIKTLCPKCSHQRQIRNRRDPCLSVNLDDGVYYCHNCEWEGKLKGGETSPSRPRYERPREVYAEPMPIKAPQTLHDRARAYVHKRGISMEVIEKAGVCGAREFMHKAGSEQDVIAFPYYRGEKIVNYKFLLPPKGEDTKDCRQVKGAERIWYGLDRCKDAEQIIITEGEIDALSMIEAGYEATISVPDGAPATNAKDYSRKFSFYDEASEYFRQAAVVLIATDTDGPGEYLAAELARRIGKLKCFRVSYPEGCKDANEVLMKHGVDRLRQCVQEATPWPVEGIVEARTLTREVLLIKAGQYYQGVSTGFKSLDQLYRPALGQMTVIVGVPQHGKTQFIDSLMLNLAHLHGWSFGTFSPENYPPALHITHMIQRMYKKNIIDISEEEIDKAIMWISRNIHVIAPDNPTLSEILQRAMILVQREGIKGFIIDPWTEVQEEGDNTQKFIKNGLTTLGRAKREHDMHIFVTTHPRKLNEERDFDGQVKTPKPGGYDIADSAHFVNKADNVITVWRDVDRAGAPIEISVIKSRFKERGRRGTMLMQYDPVSQALTDGGLLE